MRRILVPGWVLFMLACTLPFTAVEADESSYAVSTNGFRYEVSISPQHPTSQDLVTFTVVVRKKTNPADATGQPFTDGLMVATFRVRGTLGMSSYGFSGVLNNSGTALIQHQFSQELDFQETLADFRRIGGAGIPTLDAIQRVQDSKKREVLQELAKPSHLSDGRIIFQLYSRDHTQWLDEPIFVPFILSDDDPSH